MIVRTVRITDKGQITLPADTLRSLNVRKGSELVLVQEGDRIVLVKATDVGQEILEETELAKWYQLSLPALGEVWDNPIDDEVWNEYRG